MLNGGCSRLHRTARKLSVAAATTVGMTDDEIIPRIREQDEAGAEPPPARLLLYRS